MSGPSSSAPPNRTTDEHAGNARAGLGASKDALRTSVGALARADSSTGENVLRRLSLDTASVHNPTNPGAANGSALPPSPGGSLSPNHPDNLRKQARATLDSGFSVKSYVGAANTLLEKAEAADRQGQLENAFVNYLKAAGVAAFIPKHDEWKKVQEQKGPPYYRFQDFMQRVPEIISRTKRIEEQLRAREELNASAQRQQAAAAAAEMAAESGSANRRRESSLNVADSREDGRWITSSQSQKRLSAHVESNSSTWRSGPSPPPSPSPSPSPPITTPRSETPVLIDEKEPAKPPNDAASGPVATPVTSLADRLNALRGAGLSTSLVNSKRMNETYGGSRNLSALAEDDEVSGAHHDPGAGSKDGVDLATGPGTAGPALDAAPQVDIEQERPGSAPSELTHPPGKPRLPEDDRQLPADSHMPPSMTGANQENPAVDPQSFASPPLPTHAAFSIHHAISAPPHGDFADDEAMNQRFPHVPSPSEFESSYPALDTWERDTRFPSAPSHLPGNQAQQTGGGSGSGPRRPLPPPPAPPSDVDLGRSDVPHPFPERVSASAPKPAYTPSSGSADAATSKRSSVAVPTALRPGTTPPVPGASGYPKPAPARPTQVSSAASGEPVPTSGRSKPPLPFSNHVTVEDLWAYLNPTFESVTDADGSTRLVKRPAHSVLLLDLRSREEFEQGRIKAADVVCLEPITIKTGITSDEIEDKLILSPQSEQNAFSARNHFDLVVIYDRASRSLAASAGNGISGDAAEAHAKLTSVFKAIYENEFRKTLQHQPVLLIGGYESWARKVGEQGITRDKPPAPNGSRASITFEAGTRFAPNEPAPRASLDATRSRSGSAAQQIPDDVKRLRRQAHVTPEGGLQSPSLSRTQAENMPFSQPPTPGRAPPYAGHNSRNSVSSPFSGGYNASSSYAPPSIPARAYQSSTSSAPLPPSAPSFPPMAASTGRSRGDDYLNSAPSTIPYGSTNGEPARKTSGTFDYPQLRQHHTVPTPPPAAASVNGLASRPTHVPSNSISSVPSHSPTRPDPSRQQVSSAYPTQAPRPSTMDDLRIGLTGLKNLGNSCYMNSTLQCLSATIPLARFLLDGSYKKAINRVNPLGTQGALAEAFAQLVRVMWSEQYTFVSPVTFRDAISRFAPQFRGCDQHDSQEFLAFLLDGLHEDLNFVLHKPPPVDMTPAREAELETLPQQIASVKEWSIYRQRNDSLVVDWFQGQFRNKMTCLTCGKTSTTYNAFMYLSLPIPHGRGIHRATLHQCLEAFVREEVMDKADAWHCPRCNKARKATKRLSISRLPQVLLIHLKRFSFKGPFTDKIDTQVTFPTMGLDLTNYMPPPLPPGALQKGAPISQSQQPPYIYDLYGVTHHFGSLNTGHYTATIRNHGEWYYCDDSRIMKSDERQINTNSPYVLWFRRRN